MSISSNGTPLSSPRYKIEVGVDHSLPFTTPFADSYELSKISDVSVQQLSTMRKTDGQARALFRLLTQPLRAALKTATFIPEKGVVGGDEEAEFARDLLTLPATSGGMQTPFRKFISQLTLAVNDGFSAFEIVPWVPKDGPLAGKWAIKKLANRPSETVRIIVDKQGQFNGFRQIVALNGELKDVHIPRDSSFYYATQEEENPFYGLSWMLPAYYHWDNKLRLYFLAHNDAQRASSGIRVGHIPDAYDRQERQDFITALKRFGTSQYMVIPEGYSVDVVREGSSHDFLGLINHHNSMMSVSVLAQFLDKNPGGETPLVDFGRSDKSMFLLAIQDIMDDIADVINHNIIPRFIDYNFSRKRSVKYPEFRWGKVTDDQKAAITATFEKLMAAGQSVNVTRQFMRELEKLTAEEFGLPIDYEAIEKEEEERRQQEMTGAVQSPGIPGTPVATGEESKPVIPPGFPLPEGFQLSGEQSKVLELAGDVLTGAAEAASVALAAEGSESA